MSIEDAGRGTPGGATTKALCCRGLALAGGLSCTIWPRPDITYHAPSALDGPLDIVEDWADEALSEASEQIAVVKERVEYHRTALAHTALGGRILRNEVESCLFGGGCFFGPTVDVEIEPIRCGRGRASAESGDREPTFELPAQTSAGWLIDAITR